MFGVQRQLANMIGKKRDRYGHVREPWDGHIEGACGEQCVAKYFGMYWSGNFGDFKAADVGPWQVRWAQPGGRLILHKDDDRDKAFFLVTNHAPNMRLVGWCFAHEGQQAEFWKDPTGQKRDAYFVEHRILRPISSFREPRG